MKILSVTASLVERIREEIVTGQLPANTKLNEIELSERLEVSRPPLREAFRKLEYEKLVVSIPRKGTIVTSMSAKDCKQVFYARRILECSAIDIFASQGITDLPRVRRALEVCSTYRLPPHPTPHDMMDYYQIMADFHLNIIESCQNSWLVHCYNCILSSLARYQVMYLQIPGTRQPSIKDHAKVLELIETKNYGAANDLLKSHIESNMEQVVQNI